MTLLPPQTTLLIENDSATVDAIRAALATASGTSFEVEWVCLLSDGFVRLKKAGIAAVLLPMSLPDSDGIDTYQRLLAATPDIPILIISGRRARCA